MAFKFATLEDGAASIRLIYVNSLRVSVMETVRSGGFRAPCLRESDRAALAICIMARSPLGVYHRKGWHFGQM